MLEKWAKEKGVTYPIISSAEAERTYGIQSIPHKVLIDVKGNVVDEGHVALGSSTLDPLCADADVLPAGEYSKKFDAVKRAISLGQFGNAFEMTKKLESDKTDGETAKKLKDWIEERGAKSIADADKSSGDGEWFAAIETLQDVEKRWKGAEAAKNAKTKLDAVKKDKDGKRALDVYKFWATAKDAESKKDKATATQAYMKVAKACKGMKVGDEAEAKAKALQ